MPNWEPKILEYFFWLFRANFDGIRYISKDLGLLLSLPVQWRCNIKNEIWAFSPGDKVKQWAIIEARERERD